MQGMGIVKSGLKGVKPIVSKLTNYPIRAAKNLRTVIKKTAEENSITTNSQQKIDFITK